MAWVREHGETKWIEGETFTGAVVQGFAWNCPLEKDCDKRKEVHAFYLDIVKPRQLVKNGRILQVLSCGNWDNEKHICGLGINVDIKEDEK